MASCVSESASKLGALSSYKNKQFKSFGHSLRIIHGDGFIKGELVTSPQYTLISHSTTLFALNKDGSGLVQGRSVRSVAGILNPSLSIDTLPLTEVTNWSGDFEYNIEKGIVSIFYKPETAHGFIEEGVDKGKRFEEVFIAPPGEPHVVGEFSKSKQSMLIHTVGAIDRRTIYQDGKERIGSWSQTATAVLVS